MRLLGQMFGGGSIAATESVSKPEFFPLESSNDKTRFDPSRLPWTILPERAGSSCGTVFNAANEPIATLAANSAAQLNEMAKLIEQATRAR